MGILNKKKETQELNKERMAVIDDVIATLKKNKENELLDNAESFKTELENYIKDVDKITHEKTKEAIAKEEQAKNKLVQETQKLEKNLKDLNKTFEKKSAEQTKIVTVDTTLEFTYEGFEHDKTQDLIALLACGQNVLLLGGTGTGKTHTTREVAKKLNTPFYYTNAVHDEFKLVGYKNANGEYQPTPFYEAFTKGGIFLFDELDASSPEAILLVNMALANGEMSFPNGCVKKHDDFRVVATANTIEGATGTYTGRNLLDLATINRFAVLKFDYSKELEKSIICGHLNDQDKCDKVYNMIAEIRSILHKQESSLEFSTRNIVNLLGVGVRTKDTRLCKSILFTFLGVSEELDEKFNELINIII